MRTPNVIRVYERGERKKEANIFFSNTASDERLHNVQERGLA